MLWLRLAGLLAAIVITIGVLASSVQLGMALFDHGGMLPTLVLLGAFVIIGILLGTRFATRRASVYW